MAYAFVARIAGNVPVSFISLICKSIPFSARFDVFCKTVKYMLKCYLKTTDLTLLIQ